MENLRTVPPHINEGQGDNKNKIILPEDVIWKTIDTAL
jgi:hypothetical protein